MGTPSNSNHHVALFASPGLGHLIPIIELANRLVGHHGFTVTLFAVTTEAHQAEDGLLKAAASSWPDGLFNAVSLPKEPAQASAELEPNATILTRITSMVSTVIPTLRSMIAVMDTKPKVMIIDVFGAEAIKVSKEFDMITYVFVASNARFLAFALHLPYIENEVDRNEPFYIPGCEPIGGEDLLKLTFTPNGRAYREFVRIGRDITTIDGILVNSWQDLEPMTLASFNDDGSMKPIVKVPVYPVGPLVREGGPVGSLTKLMEWLDHQADESVVFVSFGSGGTMSSQQTAELSWGLELSQQRFVWVFRPPIENNTAASLFKNMDAGEVEEKLSKYLPDGFLDRTRDTGIVVPMWAPQETILSHRSVGGFFSHCGWNSVLEGIVNGLPIVAWPLYAEQNMNASIVTKELGIAVRPEVRPSEGLVTREEIKKMVRRVMVDEEGLGIRTRVKELKASANKALNEGGCSFTALSKVAKYCKREIGS